MADSKCVNLKLLKDMKKQTYDSVPDLYVRPEISVCEILNEGVLCTSGTHDSFEEDDSWIDLWEE